MTEAEDGERRQFVRLDIRQKVSYKIIGTKKLGQSLTKNISGGGIRFLAEHPLEPGTELEVALRVPDREEPVRFIGQVVWSHPPQPSRPEVGVKFIRIDPQDQALILHYTTLYP